MNGESVEWDLTVNLVLPNGQTWTVNLPNFNPDVSQVGILTLTQSKARNMNWLTIIGMIIRFIMGRIQPAAQSYAIQKGVTEREEIASIAREIVKAEPQLDFDCVMNALPNLLDKLSTIIRDKGFYDYPALVDAVLTTAVEIIRCQLGQKTTPSAQMEAELTNKLMQCGIKWGFHYFTSRDVAGSITGFLGCVLGGSTGGGGGGGGTTPPPGGGGGGGINPERPPTFKQVGRCGN